MESDIKTLVGKWMWCETITEEVMRDRFTAINIFPNYDGEVITIASDSAVMVSSPRPAIPAAALPFPTRAVASRTSAVSLCLNQVAFDLDQSVENCVSASEGFVRFGARNEQ